MFYEYTYDAKYDQYLTQVTDAHGYTSSTEYTNFGLPTLITDYNGNHMSYTYDPTRRIQIFKGPYHNEWTIENEYHVSPTQINYAITKHNLTDEESNNPVVNVLHTSTFTDGLGRIVQTKKQLDLSQVCTNTSSGYWFHVSGKIIYDEFGRVKENYLGKEQKSCSGSFENGLKTYISLNHSDVEKTSITYDILDRPIQQHIHGLNATTSFDYGYNYVSNLGQLTFERVTLPEGNISETYKDSKGRTLLTRQVDSDTNEQLDTRYTYSSLSELKTVVDAENHTTSYTYDKLGNKIQTTHPDFGTMTFKYDLAGKLVQSANQNLINNNQNIKYHYNKNLLDSIVYPSHTVTYTYGQVSDFGNGSNIVGRLSLVNDLTGTRAYKYGKLGEIVEDDRTLISTNGQMSFITQYRYDSWGRILEMIYPDGEQLFYHYNPVGQLKSIVNGDDEYYLKNIK